MNLRGCGKARTVFKMPKSFLVKNKKARRVEDEFQDGTKAAQTEDKSPGKNKLQTSLQGEIILFPFSAGPLTDYFVRSFLFNISPYTAHRYNVSPTAI